MSAALRNPAPPARPDFARLRSRIEDAIERLIAALDALDGDPDLEPTFGRLADARTDECEPIGDEDEPSLAAPETRGGSQLQWSAGSRCDGEMDDDGEPDGTEDEPILGWPNNVGMGAVTLLTSPRCQHSTLEGEWERDLAPLRGRQGA